MVDRHWHGATVSNWQREPTAVLQDRFTGTYWISCWVCSTQWVASTNRLDVRITAHEEWPVETENDFRFVPQKVTATYRTWRSWLPTQSHRYVPKLTLGVNHTNSYRYIPNVTLGVPHTKSYRYIPNLTLGVSHTKESPVQTENDARVNPHKYLPVHTENDAGVPQIRWGSRVKRIFRHPLLIEPRFSGSQIPKSHHSDWSMKCPSFITYRWQYWDLLHDRLSQFFVTAFYRLRQFTS